MEFLNYIESIISVSEKLKKQLQLSGKKKIVKKGDLLLRMNERCSHLYFIEKGLLRAYYYKDGKEITNWFAQEGEFASSFYSFIAGERSFEEIQALEDCELMELSSVELNKLYVSFPETERIGRLITENYYIRLEGRLLDLHFRSAKERYQNLLAKKTCAY